MTRRSSRSFMAPIAALAAALGVAVLLVTLALGSGGGVQAAPPAQETVSGAIQTLRARGTPTVEPTVSPNVTTVVRIETDPTDKPLPQGKEFEVRVLVDNVEHLAGFGVIISYDPKKVRPVFASAPAAGTPIGATPVNAVLKSRALGEFLASSGRQDQLFCDATAVTASTMKIACNLVGPPVCEGGAPGASGSGLLGAVYFAGRGGGATNLTLNSAGTQLALDDYEPPCDPDTSGVPKIPHRLGEDVTVKIESDSSTLLIIVVVVVVVVVAAGGAGAYVWYRRRQPGAPPPRPPLAPSP